MTLVWLGLWIVSVVGAVRATIWLTQLNDGIVRGKDADVIWKEIYRGIPPKGSFVPEAPTAPPSGPPPPPPTAGK